MNYLPHTPVGQDNKQANTKNVTPAECLPNIVQMMGSGAAKVVEIGGPQLGILGGKEQGGLMVGSNSRLGIQLTVWQWQRLLSIAAMADT